jgi:hypothetical protein
MEEGRAREGRSPAGRAPGSQQGSQGIMKAAGATGRSPRRCPPSSLYQVTLWPREDGSRTDAQSKDQNFSNRLKSQLLDARCSLSPPLKP